MIVEDLYLPQEMFTLLYPLLITSRVFGLFPVRYKKVGNQYMLQWSFAYGVYSYLVPLLLTVATLMGLANDLEKEPIDSLKMTDKKTRFVSSCDVIVVTVVAVFGMVSLPLKIKKFWSLMKCLNQANDIVPLENPEKLRNISRYFLGIILSIRIGVFTMDIVQWLIALQESGKNPVTYIKDYLAFYFLYGIVIMKELFFWHLIFFIKIRISLLNQNLIALKGTLFSNSHYNRQDIVQQNGKEVTKIFQHHNISVSKNIPNIDHFNPSPIRKLEAMRNLQDKILEAVDIVNGSIEFGVPVIMFSCLLHLIVTPYFLLLQISGYNPVNLIVYAILILGHIGRFFIIVEPCQSCINEQEKTQKILCELLKCNVDKQVKKLVLSYLLHLSQGKLKFSPCGYFEINRGLITKVAGAVTTYLVVLFQFNSNEIH